MVDLLNFLEVGVKAKSTFKSNNNLLPWNKTQTKFRSESQQILAKNFFLTNEKSAKL